MGAGGGCGLPDEGSARGDALWAERFDASSSGNAIAADRDGGFIVAGTLWSTLDCGEGPMVSEGENDVFVAKLDGSGDCQWSRRFGGELHQVANAVAVDPAGDVFVAGGFYGTADFGSGPSASAGDADIFLVKLSSAGEPLWSRTFGDADFQNAYALAAGEDGSVTVTGIFSGALDFGGGPVHSNGGKDVFLATLNQDGDPLFSTAFSNDGEQTGTSVAMSSSRLVLAGSFSGTVDFGLGPLESEASTDAYVVAFDPGGAPVFSRRLGDGAPAGAYGVAVADDRIVVGGSTEVVTSGGDGVVTQAFVLIEALTPSGDLIFSERLGPSPGYAAASTVALDGQGNTIVAGVFEDSLELCGATLTGAGGLDIFLAKLDPCGRCLWSQRFGDASAQHASAVAVDASGAIALTGRAAGTVDFGLGPLQGEAQPGMFLAKFTP